MNLTLRRSLLPLVLAVVAVTAQQSWAVSDGNYDPAQQGCSPNADDSFHPAYTEAGCYSATVHLSDATHRYVSVGVPQTPDGTAANAVEVCLDLTGTQKCARFDQGGFRPLPDRPGSPVNPGSGELHAYFGADDNLDNGEHDGSSSVANGASDGGAGQLNVAPLTAAQWLTGVLGGDGKSFLLTHPLPVADAGTGACADGLCFSLQTQRRVAYTAGKDNAPTRDAANYAGHTWDPPSCGGPSDTKADCGGHDLAWWHQHNQTTYVEPGLQIYEDPDPQGSPIGPYPVPAFYVGTCGLVVGGGDAAAFPASPVTNSAGQVVVTTGC
jgi:hypothetical protein